MESAVVVKLIRRPPRRLPLEVFQARSTGRRPGGRPGTRWRDYISQLAWVRLGIPQSELENVAGEREARWVCCHRGPTPDKRQKMNG